jgi:hypothetical protein
MALGAIVVLLPLGAYLAWIGSFGGFIDEAWRYNAERFLIGYWQTPAGLTSPATRIDRVASEAGGLLFVGALLGGLALLFGPGRGSSQASAGATATSQLSAPMAAMSQVPASSTDASGGAAHTAESQRPDLVASLDQRSALLATASQASAPPSAATEGSAVLTYPSHASAVLASASEDAASPAAASQASVPTAAPSQAAAPPAAASEGPAELAYARHASAVLAAESESAATPAAASEVPVLPAAASAETVEPAAWRQGSGAPVGVSSPSPAPTAGSQRLLLVWGAFSLVAIAGFREFAQVVPALALLAAVAFDRLWQATQENGLGLGRPLVGRLGLLAVFASIFVLSSSFQFVEWRRAMYERGPAGTPSDPEQIAAYLRQDAPRGPIFAWGNAGQIYALSGRQPATRFVIAEFTNTTSPRPNLSRDELIADLQAHPAAVIVVDPHADEPGLQLSDFPALSQVMRGCYDKVPRLPANWGIFVEADANTDAQCVPRLVAALRPG